MTTERAGELETLFQNQTIREIGDPSVLAEAVDDAVSRLSVSAVNIEGRFEIAMHQRSRLRSLKATELSDGTLRYLLWIAALLTARPPGLLVLNEPETSLHPDWLPPTRTINRQRRGAQAGAGCHARAESDRRPQRTG